MSNEAIQQGKTDPILQQLDALNGLMLHLQNTVDAHPGKDGVPPVLLPKLDLILQKLDALDGRVQAIQASVDAIANSLNLRPPQP